MDVANFLRQDEKHNQCSSERIVVTYYGCALMHMKQHSSGKLQIDWPSGKGPLEEGNANCVTLLDHAIKDCLEGSMCP